MVNTFKLKLHILEIILLLSLFFTLFVSNANVARIIIAIIFCGSAVASSILVKKKDIALSYKSQIILQMIGFAGIYVVINYLLGIYFGFYKSYESFTIDKIGKYIIPYVMIIISSEILRFELLCRKEKYVKIVIMVAMVLADIALKWQMYDFSKLNDFLSILGLVIFASIASNLLYNYISPKYGYKPIIVYRLITTLYLYIMPVLPNIYEFLQAMISIVFPYLIFLFLEYTYTKRQKVETPVGKGRRVVNIIIVFTIAIFIVLIISCKFYVGILAIGSESMTGTINKGDAVVFVKYTDQEIEDGDVIIFTKNNQTVVHRVARIIENNGEAYYYTKGDNNETVDDGYITDEDIIGISKFRIKYIGYPTIWVRDIFSA